MGDKRIIRGEFLKPGVISAVVQRVQEKVKKDCAQRKPGRSENAPGGGEGSSGKTCDREERKGQMCI